MNKTRQCIIIGGGTSIREGISKGLWEKLKGRFVVGLNYSYKYFDSTFLCYVDKLFYNKQYEELKELPLIIGKQHPQKHFPKGILPNTIVLPTKSEYSRNVKEGCYKASLCGIFALSLGIYLLDKGEIFLLGCDFGELRKRDYTKVAQSPEELKRLTVRDKDGKALTHFYQGELKHRGIGKISYFNSKDRAKNNFAPFKEEKKVKIWNVSLVSKIPDDIFEKISYDEFFERLNNQIFDQEELREKVRKKLL